ncbi:MAG: D-alanine--D-alanine ligase [Acidaminococcus sp.]|jgi:D-alanine-D-alanine ligase|nr:D-alanine--D-alanine ligase [Acidaminococcus sp.]MCI2100141.1 D-alanine--D-alanine ligase [Acidaminococcus sp.]MCI2114460.1 D-alanine--D-alanine ligase [Acidaminococcus sp.]MCI2116395.1 D-alanine--D-alanine ligase [Acidaminococcus sp.]
MNKNEKVAVVMGGPSKEREISLVTGNAIAEALKSKGYDVVTIDLDPKNFQKQVAESGATVVFNAIHGLYGEDGHVQGALEMMGIPYTGSGLLASALAMDKVYTKRLFVQQNVPTAPCLFITRGEADIKKRIMDKLGLPVVIKPATQGSSIGVSIVRSEEELDEALNNSFQYDDRILAEAFFTGTEVAAGVMMGEDGKPIAMPLVYIEPLQGYYDYHNKYTAGATKHTCPAPISAELTKKLQKIGVDAYMALGCSGVARVDLIVAKDESCIVLEVNTIPGMTPTSLVPHAAEAMGLSFPDLCEKILKTAHC